MVYVKYTKKSFPDVSGRLCDTIDLVKEENEIFSFNSEEDALKFIEARTLLFKRKILLANNIIRLDNDIWSCVSHTLKFTESCIRYIKRRYEDASNTYFEESYEIIEVHSVRK